MRERQKGKRKGSTVVVSIGHFPAFYVVLVPLEYIPKIIVSLWTFMARDKTLESGLKSR